MLFGSCLLNAKLKVYTRFGNCTAVQQSSAIAAKEFCTFCHVRHVPDTFLTESAAIGKNNTSCFQSFTAKLESSRLFFDILTSTPKLSTSLLLAGKRSRQLRMRCNESHDPGPNANLLCANPWLPTGLDIPFLPSRPLLLRHKDLGRDTMNDIPGMTSLRGLPLVGKGLLADLLEDAGYQTVACLRAVAEGDGDMAFLRQIQAAIDRLKLITQADWARVGRKAFKTLLVVRQSTLSDTDVPDPFKCPLTATWLEDPVVIPCGITCSRRELEIWLDACGTCPFTRQSLTKTQLIPNLALRDAMAMYRPLEERYLIPRQ